MRPDGVVIRHIRIAALGLGAKLCAALGKDADYAPVVGVVDALFRRQGVGFGGAHLVQGGELLMLCLHPAEVCRRKQRDKQQAQAGGVYDRQQRQVIQRKAHREYGKKPDGGNYQLNMLF